MEKVIYLAGGCFWGAQHYFDLAPGVVRTRVGYANGRTEHPTYEQVKHEHTGHAETVEVVYDPDRICLDELLGLYFEAIDPVSVNRQGHDEGEQYRTGIYYTDAEDLPVIRSCLDRLQEKYDQKLAVECKGLEQFFEAEDYHQKYLEKNPGGYCHIPLALYARVRQFRSRKQEESHDLA